MRQVRPGARWGAVVVALFLLAAFAQEASAQTWTGLGADNNWSTGANWSGGVAPTSSATTVVSFTSTTPRMTPVVDVPWTVNGINLGSSYHLTGQPITLAGAAPAIQTLAPIANAPVVDNPVVLSVPVMVRGGGISITGGISGPGSLTVSASRFVLSGANSFTGGTQIGDGTQASELALSGTMLGPVSVISGLLTAIGVLSGTGTITGPVTVTGVLDPANLTTGNLTLGKFQVNVAGPAQGTQYGVVHVNGAVDVTSSALQVLGSYVPVPGDVLTIIDNDGTDPVVGTFMGFGGRSTLCCGAIFDVPLPEGSTFLFNGVPMRISYQGGTGNDVTLTAISGAVAGPGAPVPTLSQWALILLASIVLALGMRTFARRR